MGGEKLSFFVFAPDVLGSPPHGRGKVEKRISEYQQARITPAWAGKSIQRHTACSAVQDHPRMGGEKGSMLSNLPVSSGSPPHGRGKVMQVCIATGLRGITPAWAGKRILTKVRIVSDKDHPRMGGEKPSSKPPWIPWTGSPPHGRGKGLWMPCPLPLPGITPAWAGKSTN